VKLALLAKTLRDLKWQVFWYGVGLAALAALVVYIYPSYSEQFADFEVPEALQAFIGEASFHTPQGFLTAEFFSWVPILLVIFAIMAGTSLLAGEEAEGTLDLLLAQPLGRTRLALEKMAGFAVGVFLILLIAYVGWLVSVPFVAIDVSLVRLFFATLELGPLVLLFGAGAMWCGALFPDRKLATGVVTAFAVASYFLNYIATLVDALEPLAWLSVFHYVGSSDTLTGSFDPVDLTVGLFATAVLAVLTLLSFERRDLGVHGGGLTLPFGARQAG